jgi:hypothetical protein
MVRRMAVAPRWSKKTDQLVRYVALRCRPGFPVRAGRLLHSDPRFGAFITTHQDKVRKKLTTSDDEEHRLDDDSTVGASRPGRALARTQWCALRLGRGPTAPFAILPVWSRRRPKVARAVQPHQTSARRVGVRPS